MKKLRSKDNPFSKENTLIMSFFDYSLIIIIIIISMYSINYSWYIMTFLKTFIFWRIFLVTIFFISYWWTIDKIIMQISIINAWSIRFIFIFPIICLSKLLSLLLEKFFFTHRFLNDIQRLSLSSIILLGNTKGI